MKTIAQALEGCDEEMRDRSFVVYYLPDDLLDFIRGVQNGIVTNAPSETDVD